MFFDFHQYIDLSYSYVSVEKKTDLTEPVKTRCYLDPHFNIPIEYLASEQKHELSKIVANDLELKTDSQTIKPTVMMVKIPRIWL